MKICIDFRYQSRKIDKEIKLWVGLILISDRNRERLIYRMLSIITDCYRKRLSSFYKLIIDTMLSVWFYWVIQSSWHAIGVQLSTKYYRNKNNNRNVWSFYRSSASAQLIIQEEEDVAAKVAVWNPRLVRVRVSVMLKDGSDLEGSNVHAYIAWSWQIHNARLPQKTYRKQ